MGETLTDSNQNSDLQQALALHQAGNLQQAEAIYRRILAANAKDPLATHYLGVIALQVGRVDVAIQLLEQSVHLNAGVEAAGNLGVAYRRANRLVDARNLLQQVVSAAPQFADAWANLSEVLLLLSDKAGAFAAASKAIAINPNQITALIQLANISQEHGKLDEAIDYLERAIQIQPNHVAVLTQLGLLLRHRKSYERSIRLLKQAVQIAPSHAEAYGHLAMSLIQKGERAEGIAAARLAVELAPNVPNAHSSLAEVYLAAEQLDDAETAARKAVEINPQFINGWGILSQVLDKKDDVKGLVACLEKAISIAPDHREAASNLGRAYSRDAQDEKAISTLMQVLKNHPNHAEAHGSLAFAYLAAGDLKRGFEEYEWRWHCDSFTTAPREFDRPMWQGTDPTGRTILVHSEQGYGDVIQFARYLPMLAELGAKIIVECPLPLKDLIENMEAVSKVVPSGLKLPDYDLHLPLMSLPRVFGTTRETIPNHVPYLQPDPARVAQFRDRIAKLPSGLKVGLMWAGNRKPDPRRTCPLIEFTPLSELAGVHFISLQKDSASDEISSLSHGLNITDLAPELKSFADTAAVIANLDLLLTIDTACAHLGGAMGAKTWTLLPYYADWRWQRDREDSPWYPTMQLFRQQRPNNWSNAVLQVKQQLALLIAS